MDSAAVVRVADGVGKGFFVVAEHGFIAGDVFGSVSVVFAFANTVFATQLIFSMNSYDGDSSTVLNHFASFLWKGVEYSSRFKHGYLVLYESKAY